MPLLEKKTIIVTGGNSGIGEAIVLAAAAEGANVVIDYLVSPDEGKSVIDQVEKLGAKAIAVQADVSSADDLHKLVKAAVDEFGRLDVMVNNAGIETRTGILDTSVEQFEKVVDVNMKSAFFGTQFAAKQMIDQGGGGAIINMSSIHEDQPMPGNIAYCLSKGGIRMLARTAGVELAPHDIRVVNVCPGAVDTPIDAQTSSNPTELARLKAAIPFGRMAEPSEIANLVVFLASDKASYLTATSVDIDGGMSMQSSGL